MDNATTITTASFGHNGILLFTFCLNQILPEYGLPETEKKFNALPKDGEKIYLLHVA